MPAFSSGRGRGRGDAFDLIHRGQRLHDVAAAGDLGSRFLSGRRACAVLLSGGQDTQLLQLGLGGLGHGVTIGLPVGEQMPGQQRQLVRHGHHGDVVRLPLLEATKEVSQRSRIGAHRVRRLDQHRAGMSAPLLGDVAVITVAGRLPRAGDQPQITGQRVGVREP